MLRFFSLAIALAPLAGCGFSYQPARSAAFDVDSTAHIDDDDIKKAFDAKPQMPERVRVAFYSFDPEIAADLDGALPGLTGVASVYRIPPLLVTGQRRVDEQSSWTPPREVTVKQLRLIAARARADVLFVVDHGFKTSGLNGLAVLNALLVPVFFTPFVDTRVQGYAEGFVLDVRNGYLYGHVTEDDRRGKRFATIYDPSGSDLAKEQWGDLEIALLRDLNRVLEQERGRSPGAVAKP